MSPPWFVITTLHRKIEHRSATDERTFTGAAGVSPPWVSKPRLQLQCNEFRISRSHRMHPTGGLRPPLLCCSANVCRRKAIFAMHKRASDQERRASARRGSWYRRCTAKIEHRSATDERTFTGAAGVSPPWCGKHVCVDTSAIVRRTADGVRAGRRCIRGNSYHGGLTPPALASLCARLPTKKRFLRCTYAHPIRSGGREPAVG